MKKRRGRKPKTLKEKQQEMKEKLDKIIRISSVFHNIQRNKHTRRISKLHLRKFEKELKASRDKEERETLKFLLKDYQGTVDKMENFIKEDLAFINKELKMIKLNGVKKDAT